MSDGEQDYGAWRAEQQRRAQAHAFGWAERASSEYDQAVRHEDDARERQQYDSGWQRDRMAESRALATFHGVRSTEALKLAEMWARVASALTDPAPPAVTVQNSLGTTTRSSPDDLVRSVHPG